MSIVQEAIAYAPYAGAALGYGVGQAAEHVARTGIAANRNALLGAHTGVQSPDLVDRSWARKAVTELALLGAVTGFAVGQTVAPASERAAEEPVVAMVVDRSYGTTDQNAYKRIDRLAVQVSEDGDMDIRPIVASDSGYATPSAENSFQDLLGESPFGAPTVNTATSAAVDLVGSEALDVATDQGKQRNGAVLVITDGNPAGNVRTITEKAEDQSVTINIVNTGSTESQTARSLARIAERTDGQFWNLTEENEAEIPEQLLENTLPQTAGESDNKDRAMWGVLGAVMLVASVRRFARRKSETAVS